MIRLAVLVAASLLLIAPGAHAQDLIGFQSPSKNIACQFYDNDGPLLRCDIGETSTQPPSQPRDCPLEWGHSFEMSPRGGASRICAGDTVMDPRLPLLAYGEVWQRAGFTCRSEQTGLTCFNVMQHGFALSRSEQRLF